MIVTRPRSQAASMSQAAHKFSEIALNCALLNKKPSPVEARFVRNERGNRYKTFARNCCKRGCAGLSNTACGLSSTNSLPSSINSTRSATSRAKPISCVTITMVMPSLANPLITSNTSPPFLGQGPMSVHRTALNPVSSPAREQSPPVAADRRTSATGSCSCDRPDRHA